MLRAPFSSRFTLFEKGCRAGDSGGSGLRLCRILNMDFRERPEAELCRTPLSGSSRQRESLHSPTPKGQVPQKRDAYTVRYHAPEQQVKPRAFLGVWGGAMS